MAVIDWVIVAFILVTVLAAAKSGLIVEVCSLAGLILGLMLASWDYEILLPWTKQWIHTQEMAQAAAFFGVFLAVMIVAGIVGRLIRWSVKSVGLGWADRTAGAVFGLVKGCALVTIAAMVIAAFWPSATWFRESHLAPEFLSMADHVSIVAPSDLKEKIQHGVTNLRKSQPDWMKPVA
ncbi:MAG: CvpA family protein [Acidobacteriaceae bacterium]